MASSQIVQFEALRTLAFGSISGTYAKLGTPLLYPARQIIITNTSNGNLLVSDDGVNDKLIVPSSSFLLLDFTTNKLQVDQYFVAWAGTQFWVKQSSAPSSGAIFLASIYGVNPAFVTGVN